MVIKLNFAIERWDMDYDFTSSNIKPNFMQRKALKELNRYRAVGTGRALVVAAAGSGKTYLAAFDALNFNPKKLLYIVHEGSILKNPWKHLRMCLGIVLLMASSVVKARRWMQILCSLQISLCADRLNCFPKMSLITLL